MKRAENVQMRNQILDSVIACKIQAEGDDVSLSQISCRAGISERTVNRYFPDKEIMLYDASVRYLQEVFDTFAKKYDMLNRPGVSGLERLLVLIRLQIDLYRNDIATARVFVRAFTTALRTAMYRHLPVAGYDAATRDLLIACVEDGIRDGSIRRDAVPMDMYYLISSNFNGLVQRLIYTYSVDASEEEHRRELLVVFDQYVCMLEQFLRNTSVEA